MEIINQSSVFLNHCGLGAYISCMLGSCYATLHSQLPSVSKVCYYWLILATEDGNKKYEAINKYWKEVKVV